MLRTGQLHRAPPRPRDLARRRECCYRGPWRLPGPDSHRLAAMSLSLGYVVVSSFRCSSAPELLDAHSPGITARGSGRCPIASVALTCRVRSAVSVAAAASGLLSGSSLAFPVDPLPSAAQLPPSMTRVTVRP